MFQILKGGCSSKHPASFRMTRPEGLPNYVILIMKTDCEIYINETQYSVSPGHALLISPNTSYYYGNPNGIYMDDWLHFNIKDMHYFEMKQIALNKPFIIQNTDTYTTLIRQILWENSYGAAPYVLENINSLFTVLFNHLTIAYHDIKHMKPTSDYDKQLELLRFEILNNVADDHNLTRYAKKLGISTSYFQHLYTTFFGISFRQDIIQLRIEQAKYLMNTSTLTLEQISEYCGYQNDVHFYRQFKQITGSTPAKYRKVSTAISSI